MTIEVSEGHVAAARQMARGTAASLGITAVMCMQYVPGTAILRRNLEATSGEELPRPDLRMQWTQTLP